jgi:hypothetical protein
MSRRRADRLLASTVTVAVALAGVGGPVAARAAESISWAAPSRVGVVAGGTRLATTANGQLVRCLDGQRGSVLSFEPDRPDSPRTVIAPGATCELLAIGCLPGDVIAVVGHDAGVWWLRTYRAEPTVAVDPAEPLQEIGLGHAGEPQGPVTIVASSARSWLAVVGLPAPLSPVLRAAVAGVRIGPVSNRSCPVLPAGFRPVAAAVSPRDELVLALEPPGDASAVLGFYDRAGQERARFDMALAKVRSLAFDRRGTTLCATGQEVAGGRSGVWRLDATFRNGRQAIAAVPVALLPARDLAAVADDRFIMLADEPPGALFLIDPTPQPPAETRMTPPGDAPP